MARQAAIQASRLAHGALASSSRARVGGRMRSTGCRLNFLSYAPHQLALSNLYPAAACFRARRQLSTSSSALRKGLSPESGDPPPKESEGSRSSRLVAADITDDEYHDLADAYLDKVLLRLEELQDEKDGIDVEYSSGVLTLSFPPVGTYVINKQPPNKQIWLSSPESGPKRYDWVMLGEGQDQKEGTATGEWIYLRDGTSLNDLFNKELGIDVPLPGTPE